MEEVGSCLPPIVVLVGDLRREQLQLFPPVVQPGCFQQLRGRAGPHLPGILCAQLATVHPVILVPERLRSVAP